MVPSVLHMTPVVKLLLMLLAAATAVCQAAHDGSSSFDNDLGLAAAARALHKHWQRDPANKQCFAFSLDGSIARDDFEYPDAATGERKTAKKGERTCTNLWYLRCSTSA
jgi:hypothetical protein